MGQSKNEFMEVRSKSLYNITDDYLNIELMLLEDDGEVTEATEKALAINKQELQQKAQGYIGVINKLSNEVDYVDSEIKRLTELKNVRKNAIDRMKNAISAAMQVYEIEKIETPLNKISFRKSESVNILCDVEKLPTFAKKIEVKAISKTELKKMLKDGTVIAGVELVSNKSLQIK